jgi:hypothetical protein
VGGHFELAENVLMHAGEKNFLPQIPVGRYFAANSGGKIFFS